MAFSSVFYVSEDQTSKFMKLESQVEVRETGKHVKQAWLILVNGTRWFSTKNNHQHTHLPTFIVYEECIWGQGVLVVGDILQYVCQIHVHSNYTQQQVPKVAWPADGHDETYKRKGSSFQSVPILISHTK